MAYVTTNPPVRVWGSVSGASGWYYTQPDDDDATIMAANFISNAQDLGMKVGDVVHIWTTTGTDIGSTTWVSAVDSSGCTLIFSVIS